MSFLPAAPAPYLRTLETYPAADYRKIFTGLIFLKYISTAFEKKYAELLAGGDGFEDPPEHVAVADSKVRPFTASRACLDL